MQVFHCGNRESLHCWYTVCCCICIIIYIYIHVCVLLYMYIYIYLFIYRYTYTHVAALTNTCLLLHLVQTQQRESYLPAHLRNPKDPRRAKNGATLCWQLSVWAQQQDWKHQQVGYTRINCMGRYSSCSSTVSATRSESAGGEATQKQHGGQMC